MSNEPVVSTPGDDDVLLRVDNVVKYFPVSSSQLFRRQRDFVHAVEGVSLEVRRGRPSAWSARPAAASPR